MSLTLSEYRDRLDLDHPRTVEPDPVWEESLRPVLAELGVDVLADASTAQMVEALHAMLAPIGPHVLDENLVARIETIGAGRLVANEQTVSTELPTIGHELQSTYPAANLVSLWVGDITRLNVDVIVNAANRGLLGCRIPGHRCIDNAIHSAAGPRLRDDCSMIIEAQGVVEPVGDAKLTHAYALPATYVAHTVGPQLTPGATPSELERDQLASCYRSCLELVAQVDTIRTIAFCGISTGLFAFPPEPAARIALATVADWVAVNPDRFDRIVIDCFTATDESIYTEILDDW